MAKLCVVKSISPQTNAAREAGQVQTFTKRDLGCIIDESSGSADDLNERTIELAREYGFAHDGLYDGCFDGTRGQYIRMSREDAESASHSGQCDEDVAALLDDPAIVAQFDAMKPDDIRAGLAEYGAWDEAELADDAQNRARAVWSAACDLRENIGQILSELADDAVSFLNDIPAPSYCSWFFEDNSLFFLPSIENAKEDVGFVSSRSQDYPSDDYRGEWLHISDHGNATLCVRNEDGTDTEIWSLV